ncbi:CYTH domain-containing protein [Turicibacter sp. TJ11]|uniref:CYTH domain-containing protein n=1 Tax=Turicibacter sp. TJ11 TaxID=2806443 RepID=UPI001F475825|nr:CYTH domain-containing protein [Turicibacter sp. TJ11]
MSTNLEIEFKNMLDESEYKKLIEHFAIEENQIWTQKNVYFDTKTFDLNKNQAALRVRIKNNTYELTLKTKADVGVIETNQLITKSDYANLKHDHLLVKGLVYDKLLELGIDVNKLRVITDLTTKRAEVSYEDGLLVLDKSFYGEVIDFELEYEVKDYNEGLKIFNELLNQHHIPKRPAENKIKRATMAILK